MTPDQEQMRKYRRRAQDAESKLSRATMFIRDVLTQRSTAMVDPQVCDNCRHVMPEREIPLKLVLKGTWDNPPEYVTLCPECGAKESFQSAVKCHECGSYPCDCVEQTE